VKRCSKCGYQKPLGEFYRSSNAKDGLQSWCKECSKAAGRQNSRNNREAGREADRRYAQTPGYKTNRKARREGPQRERILQQKRDSWARHSDKTNAKTRELRQEQPERFQQYRDTQYANNREKILERNRRWRDENLDAERRRRLKREYGITPEDFTRMLGEQNGRCAICGTEIKGILEPLLDGLRTGIHIDHDHATGKVRGLLCGPCNKGLGHFKDNLARMRAAIDYLEKHGRDPAA